MRDYAAQFLAGALYVAILYTLVRPGSPAAGAIKTVGSALTAVVGSATGYNQIGGIG